MRDYPQTQGGVLGVATDREPEIINVRNTLSNQLNELTEVWHLLLDKIKPALAQPPTQPASATEKPHPPTKLYQSQLATQFVPLMDTLRGITDQINTVRQFVEL